jgi:hypothetical protein
MKPNVHLTPEEQREFFKHYEKLKVKPANQKELEAGVREWYFKTYERNNYMAPGRYRKINHRV